MSIQLYFKHIAKWKKGNKIGFFLNWKTVFFSGTSNKVTCIKNFKFEKIMKMVAKLFCKSVYNAIFFIYANYSSDILF